MVDKVDKKLSFEEAKEQLVKVVQELESGGLTLEQSLNLWEKGQQLGEICRNKLNEAQQIIETTLKQTDQTNS